MKRSLETLQAGRALAALSVLLFHTNGSLAAPKYLGRDIFNIFNAGYSGVNYFFVLSGFVIFLAHGHELGRSDKVISFFWKRFRRIYPPLLAVLILVLPVYFLVPSFGSSEATAPWTIVSAFLALPAEREDLLAVEWTLRHEILFYIVFGILIWKPRFGAAIATTWFLLSAIPSLFVSGYPLSFYFSSYHVLFGFGVIAALAFTRGFDKGPIAMLGVGGAVFAVTWSVVLRGVESGDLATLAFGLGATLIVLGAANLERTRALRLPRLLTFLGEASYAIYLVHYPAISATSKIIVAFDGQLPDAVLFLVTAGIAMGAGILFHLVVEKRVIDWVPRRPATNPPSVVTKFSN